MWVLLDLDLPAVEATAEGNDQLALQDHQQWYKQAANFMAGATKSTQGEKPKQKYRAKAAKWLKSLDWMLTVSTGRGLERFLLPKEISERKPPAEWDIVSIALDQGSDSWAATSFLGFATSKWTHRIGAGTTASWP